MLLRWWRDRGWQTGSEADYRGAHQRYGGSVITHPDFITAVSRFAAVPIRFLVSRERDGSGNPLAAVATWGGYVAGTKRAVRHFGVRDYVDLGHSEVILPMAPQFRGSLGYRCEYLSGLHQGNIRNARVMASSQALAKGIHIGEDEALVSNKLRKGIRRYQRMFEQQGGEVIAVSALSAQELADEYRRLFALRWDKPPVASRHLGQALELLAPFLTGHLLLLKGEPIAVQLLYMARSCRFLSVEYTNGGMDPRHGELNPGTLLNYVNVAAIEREAAAAGLQMHYSFGRFDVEYKRRWCEAVPALRC